jgi:hypothetical protein
LTQDSARQESFAHHEAAGDVLAALLGTTYSARAKALSETEIKFVDDVSEWTQVESLLKKHCNRSLLTLY